MSKILDKDTGRKTPFFRHFCSAIQKSIKVFNSYLIAEVKHPVQKLGNQHNSDLGGAMVQRACSNGHAISKGLGQSTTSDKWSFFASNNVSALNSQTSTLTSVPCATITQLKAIRGTCKATNNKKITHLRFYKKQKQEIINQQHS